MVVTNRRGRGLVLGLLCTAQFLVIANLTVVTIALPALQRDLGLGAASVHWVITVYTLLFGGTLLLSARLADRLGHRRIFVAGLLVFAAGSLGCGLAGHAAVLLTARGVQGLGAAAVAAAALVVLIDAFPPGRRRTRALGVWSAAQAAGGASGWLIGGVLSEVAGWQWVFLGNVPPAVLAAAVAPSVLPAARVRATGRPDVLGAALVTGGLFLIVFALTELGRDATLAASALAVGALALAGFALVERRAVDPVLPPRALRDRPLLTGVAVLGLANALVTPALMLAAWYLQTVAGLGAAASGLMFVPFNLAVIAGSFLAARRAGNRITTMALGLGAIAAGAAILPLSSESAMLAGFVALGLGGGAASVAANAEGTATVAGERNGVASGLLNTAAELGVGFGTAVLLTVAGQGGHRLSLIIITIVALVTALTLCSPPVNPNRGNRAPALPSVRGVRRCSSRTPT